MQAMGIISCNIFEDEIVHLVEHDCEIEEVLIIKNNNSGGIARKLQEIGYPFREVTLEKMAGYVKSEFKEGKGPVLVINILEIVGFTKRRSVLKLRVYESIMRMSLFSDGLMLMYGLCGNLLKDIEQDFEHLDCPLFTLKDEEDNIVDDCICATLGGKKAFVDTVKSFKKQRAFMLTPMWAANWQCMVVANGFARSSDMIEESKLVFRAAKYSHVAKLNTGLKYQKDFEPKVREFANFYDFEIRELETDLAIFERCYGDLKNTVRNSV